MCRLHSSLSCRKPPSINTQVSKKLRSFKSKLDSRAVLHSLLVFEISLVLGAWNLGFHFRHLMAEVPDPGEDHRHITIVRGGDDLLVAH